MTELLVHILFPDGVGIALPVSSRAMFCIPSQLSTYSEYNRRTTSALSLATMSLPTALSLLYPYGGRPEGSRPLAIRRWRPSLAYSDSRSDSHSAMVARIARNMSATPLCRVSMGSSVQIRATPSSRISWTAFRVNRAFLMNRDSLVTRTASGRRSASASITALKPALSAFRPVSPPSESSPITCQPLASAYFPRLSGWETIL